MNINPINMNIESSNIKAQQQTAKTKNIQASFDNLLQNNSLKKEYRVERLKKAAHDLESVMLYQMIKSMRDTVPEGGLVKKNMGEKIFRSMLDEKYANMMSSNHSFGMAQMIIDTYKPYLK